MDATPHNDHILKHARRLDSKTGAQKYEADLFLDGQFFDTGIFTITNTSNKSYSYTFKNKTLDIVDELKAFKLKTIDEMQYLPELYCPDIVGEVALPLVPNPYPYLIEVGGIIFTRPLFEQQELVDDINQIYPDMVILLQASGASMMVLFQCLDSFNPVGINFRPEGFSEQEYHFFNESAISNLREVAIEANQNYWKERLVNINNDPESSHVFPVYRNPNQYSDNEDFLFQYSGYINYNLGGFYRVNSSPQPNNSWSWAISPMVRLRWILKQIRLNSSISEFFGKFLEDDEIQNLIFHSNKTLDKLVTIPGIEDTYLNIWADRYNLADHLPDINAFELFQSLGNDFCLVYRFIDNLFEMEPCRDLLNGDIEDWTHLGTPDFKAKTASHVPFSLRYTRDEEEPRIDGQLEETNGGTDAKEFKLDYYTAFDEKGSDRRATGRKWTTPLIHEEGASDPINLKKESNNVRLLFYRGIHQDSISGEYPLAQHGNENYAGESTGNYSLAWDGPAGRYEQWFKDYITLLTEGDEVTKTMRFTINEVLKIRDFRNVRKQIWHKEGLMTAVVKSVQIKSYPDRPVTEATIKFIQQ